MDRGKPTSPNMEIPSIGGNSSSSSSSTASGKKRRRSDITKKPYLSYETQLTGGLLDYKLSQTKPSTPPPLMPSPPSPPPPLPPTTSNEITTMETDEESSQASSSLQLPEEQYAMPNGSSLLSSGGKLQSFYKQTVEDLKNEMSSSSSSSDDEDDEEEEAEKQPSMVSQQQQPSPPKVRKPPAKRRTVNIFPGESVELYAVRIADIDVSSSVYENTLRLIRARFTPRMPLRRIAEFLLQHTYESTGCQLTEANLRYLGMERDLTYMFQRSHSFFTNQQIYFTMRTCGDTSDDKILLFDFKNIMDIFRLILPKHFSHFMYLQANVAYVQHFAMQKPNYSPPGTACK